MRLYMSDASVPDLRRCRQRAPAHSFGRVWTPSCYRDGAQYIVDNGAFVADRDGHEWNPDPWIELLDTVEKHPWPPDFVVLPDVVGDAELSLERHREYIDEVTRRGLRPAGVIQPGMDERLQVRLADKLGAKVAFVGGDNTWKRAFGDTIVDIAHEHNMAVHIGGPGLPGGLTWAQQIGADSVDTASIVRNGSFHHLDELESPLSTGALKNGTQSKLPVND